MIIASSNTTIPNGGNAEFRLHKYHSNIVDVVYYRPEAGHSGKATLRSFLEDAKNGKYQLCITLNLRDDLGGKKFRIRPINEYTDAARQVAELFRQYNINGFINIWSEPIYRYKISIQTAVDYILAVHHVIGDTLLGVPGDEINLFLGTPGFVDKITSIPIVDILTVHDLTPTLDEINHVKQHWSGKIAQVETGSQGLNYDRPEVADWIYNIFKMYYNAGIWWCGLVYVDSWTDRNYAARWWDYNYTRIEHVTPTYYKWLQARKDFDMEYNRPFDLQFVYDAFDWKFPYNWTLPNLPVVGEKNPDGIVKWADIDAMSETQYKALIYALKKSGALPSSFPDYPDIKYINGIWNINWQVKAKENVKLEV